MGETGIKQTHTRARTQKTHINRGRSRRTQKKKKKWEHRKCYNADTQNEKFQFQSFIPIPKTAQLLQINAGSHQLQTVTDSPYAKPNKATNATTYYTSTTTTSHTVKQNQLDSMLGNLQADMSRQGINTTQKGCCSACDKPIVGQVSLPLFKTIPKLNVQHF